MIRKLLAGLVVVLAGVGLTGCNGNLNPIANCQLAQATMSLPQGNDTWILWDASFGITNAGRTVVHYCQLFSLNDGFVNFRILDSDEVIGGDGSWNVGHLSFTSWFRFHLPGTAVYCEAQQTPLLPDGCP